MYIVEYLDQIKMINIKIEGKKAEIEMLKKLAILIKDVDNKRICSAVEDLSNLIDECIQEQKEKEKHILKNLDLIHDVNTYDVMHMKYIQFMEIKEIAMNMGYTEQWIHTLHREGLKILERSLNKSEIEG